MDEILNKKEAAKFLRISEETLDKYLIGGKLTCRKIGRRVVFLKRDLFNFLDLCAIPATVIPTSREKLEMAKAIGGRI